MIASEEIVIPPQFSTKDIDNQLNNLKKLSSRNRGFAFDKEELNNELLSLDTHNKELKMNSRNLSGRSINPTKRELFLDFRAAIKANDPLQMTKTISKPITSPRSPRSPHSPRSPRSNSHGTLPNLPIDSPHSVGRNLGINNRNSWHSSLDNIHVLDKRTRSTSDKTTDSSNTNIIDMEDFSPHSGISLEEISKEIQVIEYSEISNTILPNVVSIVSPRSAFTPISLSNTQQ